MCVQEGGSVRVSVDTARIEAVLDVTRIWWDLGEGCQPHLIDTLHPDEVLGVLQAGDCAAWQSWSFKSLPPWRTPRFIAASAAGVVCGPRLDLACVVQVCERVMKLERLRDARDDADAEGESFALWELEDS